MADSRGRNKEELFWKILNTAIELDFKKGHLKWSITDLSRHSGITRSLIYYYFGQSRLDIVLEAVKMLGTEVFGLTKSRLEMWQSGQIAEAIIESRRILVKSPAIAAFYATHRARDSEIGKVLAKYEMEYIEKLRGHLPDRSAEELEIIWAAIFGITTVPGIHEQSILKMGDKIRDLIIGRR